jgi:hypothetical protein
MLIEERASPEFGFARWPDGQISARATRWASLVSSPSDENISLRCLLDTALLIPVIPRFSRGALRDRHERWVRDAMDASCAQTTRSDADGEVVWA